MIPINPGRNRPDGAGASWSEEEDKQLDEEFNSGMKISEMAKIHNRTNGAIRARLRKHGLIGSAKKAEKAAAKAEKKTAKTAKKTK